MDILIRVGFPLLAGLAVAGIIWGVSVLMEKKQKKKQTVDDSIYEDE